MTLMLLIFADYTFVIDSCDSFNYYYVSAIISKIRVICVPLKF